MSNPIFNDKGFLIDHIESVMKFYHPHCINNNTGGFFQYFRDDAVFMILIPSIW